MIAGIGIDIVQISRIKKAMERTPRFEEKVYTDCERAYVHRGEKPNYASAAGIFAAKEAVVKAFGTGFRKLQPRDIEVRHEENGAPFVRIAKGNGGAGKIWVSISHEMEYAVAQAIWEIEEDAP